MSILDGVALPYKADESPGAPSPSSDSAGQPAATAPPGGGILKDITLPYQAGQSPGPPKTPPGPSWTHAIWNSITGEDQPPVELQPRSLSQAGTDVLNYGRVLGNQAFVPGSLDVGLAALHGTDVSAENAKTKAAESQLDPVAAAIARFQGQRLSVNRMVGEAGVPYANSPLAQGVVTGGGGTLLQGGSWKDALTNAAADTGLSALGHAVGTGASAAAKTVFDRSSKAVSSGATAALEDLQSIKQRGGDVAAAADNYAASAVGAAKDAYQRIADAARQSTETGPLQRFTAGVIGHYLPGGALATAYIADPAIKAYNQFSKGLDVTHAIHQAYEPVASVVKSAIDPDAWRRTFQNLAVSQGPTGPGTLDAVRKFGPVSWAKSFLPGSQ